MKNLRKVTLAASTFAFAALFSFGWSGQSGVSLSIDTHECCWRRTPTTPAGRSRHGGRYRHRGRYRRHRALLHGCGLLRG